MQYKMTSDQHWGIAFNTAHGRIKGARDLWGAISNEADFIFVDGDKVSFYVSGVDFPATAKPPKPIADPGRAVRRSRKGSRNSVRGSFLAGIMCGRARRGGWLRSGQFSGLPPLDRADGCGFGHNGRGAPFPAGLSFARPMLPLVFSLRERMVHAKTVPKT